MNVNAMNERKYTVVVKVSNIEYEIGEEIEHDTLDEEVRNFVDDMFGRDEIYTEDIDGYEVGLDVSVESVDPLE